MKKTLLTIVLIAFSLSSCRLDPKYQIPESDVVFVEGSSGKIKVSKIFWKKFFKSKDLQRIIELALDHNKDLKIANLNIEAARATYGISRSNLFPSISVSAYETRQGVPSAFSSFTAKKQYRTNLNLASFELDFFGRLRSLKDADLESFLATTEARNVTRISLIAEVANAYAQLLLDQRILRLYEINLDLQMQQSDLVKIRYEKGIDAKSDFLDALALVETARINKDSYEKIVKQDENNLMLLTGVFSDKSLPKANTLEDIEIDESLLDFVPSEILLSRPDIRQVEHELKSANANIGAARAAFFPSITLTGNYGYGARKLDSLFESKSWSYTPQINLPIFNGGENIANLKLSKAEKNVKVVEYEKAIQTAFSEAKDELAQRKYEVSQLKSNREILHAREQSYEISQRKNEEGIISALDLIDSEISLLTAEESFATAKKSYIVNLINLYKVMGGGSEIEGEEEV